MLPPVFQLIAASTAVKAIIGSNPVRCYRHGEAPQKVQVPYLTWYLPSGRPEIHLDEVPRVDENTVHIDCWSNDDAQVVTLATAVRDAIEPSHPMISIGPNGRDPETMRYRLGMDFTFWTDRP